MTPLEILTVARDIVAQDDWWTKDILCDTAGRVCANGALVVAAVGGCVPTLREDNWETMNSGPSYPNEVIRELRRRRCYDLANNLQTATILLGKVIADGADVTGLEGAQSEIWVFNDNRGSDELPDLETTQADVVQAFDYAIKFAAEA